MITVIGLGQAGCGIADKLSRYPQYKIYMIDVGIEEAENTYSIEKQSSVEEYEEKCPSLGEFFENVEGDVLRGLRRYISDIPQGTASVERERLQH